jgi:hypothetical protein
MCKRDSELLRFNYNPISFYYNLLLLKNEQTSHATLYVLGHYYFIFDTYTYECGGWSLGLL